MDVDRYTSVADSPALLLLAAKPDWCSPRHTLDGQSCPWPRPRKAATIELDAPPNEDLRVARARPTPRRPASPAAARARSVLPRSQPCRQPSGRLHRGLAAGRACRARGAALTQ